MDFGFTKDKSRFDAAVAYKAAAIADGWDARPIYESESIDSATRLEKEGFIMMVYTRKDAGRGGQMMVTIDIWGPDELAIRPPSTYEWEAIKAGLTTCNYCQKPNVPVQRVGFAGRSCVDCLPAQRKIQEYPGWAK